MDTDQRVLFGGFPRSVGVATPEWEGTELRQFLVHSAAEFTGVMDDRDGLSNLYASISGFTPIRKDGVFQGCTIDADKVSWDLDSAAKARPEAESRWNHPAIAEDPTDAEVIDLMRDAEHVREAVLADVCRDARKLAQRSQNDEIPVVGVFSGTGLHVHQLYEQTRSRPADKMGSISSQFVAECGLSTVDGSATGKPYRILRVPNVERVDPVDGPTGLFTVPLTGAELASVTPEDLMDLSDCPRRGTLSEPAERPSMVIQEEYLGPGSSDEVTQESMRAVPESSALADEGLEVIIRDLVKMPCVVERALARNPPNDVRVKFGIMLLNAGLSVDRITEIIGRIGWADFDPETTSYQLRKLKESGKGDWSCQTMQRKGLCTRADCKTECPTFGYSGGNEP